MRILYYTSGSEIRCTKDLVGDNEVPSYTILSYTWDEGQEVTFDDLVKNSGKGKTGYDKIRFCAQKAKRDGLEHFWVKSVSFDKANSSELLQAIVSMFQCYTNAMRR
jgi:uncharacterized protein YegJ (DUF2314 family)